MTTMITSTAINAHHLVQTCIWPSPPGLNESYPERSFYEQSTGEVLEDVVVKDGQTSVVRQTSVDSREPVDFLFSVNLVTSRVVDNSVLTARLCSDNSKLTHTFNYCSQLQVVHFSKKSQFTTLLRTTFANLHNGNNKYHIR